MNRLDINIQKAEEELKAKKIKIGGMEAEVPKLKVECYDLEENIQEMKKQREAFQEEEEQKLIENTPKVSAQHSYFRFRDIISGFEDELPSPESGNLMDLAVEVNTVWEANRAQNVVLDSRILHDMFRLARRQVEAIVIPGPLK